MPDVQPGSDVTLGRNADACNHLDKFLRQETRHPHQRAHASQPDVSNHQVTQSKYCGGPKTLRKRYYRQSVPGPRSPIPPIILVKCPEQPEANFPCGSCDGVCEI